MAETDQVWDWRIELREEDGSELQLLRETIAQLRGQLDRATASLITTRQRERDVRQALRELDAARPWRRRRLRAALRERQLL